MTKTFIKYKSAGCPKITARVAHGYSGLNKWNVLKVIRNDLKLRRSNGQFTKPFLRELIFADFEFSEL